MDARDVYIVAQATVIKEGSTHRIVVVADVTEYVSGSPQGRPLAAEDPSRPTWIQGKLDGITVDVHERLASCVQAPASAAATTDRAAEPSGGGSSGR